MGVSIHDYLEWREQSVSFTHLVALHQGTVNVRWSDEPERFRSAFVTANTFPALGADAQIGRTFTEDEGEPGSPAAVVLAYPVWMDRFGGALPRSAGSWRATASRPRSNPAARTSGYRST